MSGRSAATHSHSCSQTCNTTSFMRCSKLTDLYIQASFQNTAVCSEVTPNTGAESIPGIATGRGWGLLRTEVSLSEVVADARDGDGTCITRGPVGFWCRKFSKHTQTATHVPVVACKICRSPNDLLICRTSNMRGVKRNMLLGGQAR